MSKEYFLERIKYHREQIKLCDRELRELANKVVKKK